VAILQVIFLLNGYFPIRCKYFTLILCICV